MLAIGDEQRFSDELLASRVGAFSDMFSRLGIDLAARLPRATPAAQVAVMFQVAHVIRKHRSVKEADVIVDSLAWLSNGSALLRVAGLPNGKPVATAERIVSASADRGLMDAALELVSATGWRQRVDANVGLVVIIGDVVSGTQICSWTNPTILHTIHQDLIQSRLIMARDLVHEATHLALNNALESLDLKLDRDTPAYYSPWKKVDRPEFGFLHSIASFVTVVDFLESALAHLSGTEADVCARLIKAEVERLAQARPAAERFATEARSDAVSLAEPIFGRLFELTSDKT